MSSEEDEKEKQLQAAIVGLMKKHGTRSLLASTIAILQKYKTDEIDAKLIDDLDAAGGDYARSMGLEWYRPYYLH
jgi:hypothetical protein